MKLHSFIPVLFVFCVLLAPVALSAKNVVIFQKQAPTVQDKSSFSDDGFHHHEDYRLPKRVMQRHRGIGNSGPVNFLCDFITAGLTNSTTGTSTGFTALPPSTGIAFDYLQHIYPSHNFW